MQQKNWCNVSAVVLVCAMALAGLGAVGLGFAWRLGTISPNLLGLCFVLVTALAGALVFYNRTHPSWAPTAS
jgi:hypothetical protein